MMTRDMTKEQLFNVLELHKKWYNDEDGGIKADLSNVNLAGAELSGVNLEYANLIGANLAMANLRAASLRGTALDHANLTGTKFEGARINWNSRWLISELLFRDAGRNVRRRELAGLVRISTDWCWEDFIRIKHPEEEWAINVLSKYVGKNDIVPFSVKPICQ